MTSTMKAIVKARRGPGLELAIRPIPEIGPRDVLVQVTAASICGTDLHIYNWDAVMQDRMKPPVIVGHEIHGMVVDRGDLVTTPQIGERVSLESHIVCNECIYCRTGRGHICKNTSIIGVDCNGGFAEYIAINAQNAWVVPEDLPSKTAVLYENFGNAVHTAFVTNVAAKNVLITGCGPVGLMCIAAVRAAGARKIFAIEIAPYRQQLALTMGADVVINPAHDNVTQIIAEATGDEGVDILLEMSGKPAAIDLGFMLLRPGGEAAILGLPDPFLFNFAERIVFRGITVHGIAGRRLWDTWYRADQLLRTKVVDLSPIVTHEFSMDNFEQAFEIFVSGKSGKVVLYP